MATTTLPTITQADIESHNTAKSCYVTVGTKVYDVTDFLEDHPGGADLILEHAGKDVGEVMRDEISHVHTEAAYEILEEHLIGFVTKDKRQAESKANGAANGTANGTPSRPVYVATGMSSAEDLNTETDATADYAAHKFLDLNRPLFMQVWNGGFSKDFYLEQVHRPRHYKGGDSAPFFGNFLEPFSKTPWWVVPTLWLPPVFYGTWLSQWGLNSPIQAGLYWLLGLFIWTIVEYVMHRFLFHLDEYLPNNRVGITLHFTLHGVHHYLPMDKYRLVMPPALFLVLAIPFWKLAHTVFFYDWYAATAVFCGGVFGYTCYDMTHYFLHHKTLPAYWRELKKYHLQHHFADFQNGFGVTSRFWDRVFGTELQLPPPKVLKSQ